MFKKPITKAVRDPEAPSLREQRDNILKNFDFKTLAKVMALPCRPIYRDDNCEELVGYEPWRVFTKEGFIVPDEAELRQSAERLLNQVMVQSLNGDKYIWMACGPFKVTFRYGILELEAILTSWSWD